MRTPLRDLVEASATEGVAAEEAPDGKRQAADGAVGGDGDGSILRAGGLVAAAAGVERMNGGRKPAAVKGDSGEQQAG